MAHPVNSNPSLNLQDFQVRHALTHAEIVVVVPMKPQPPIFTTVSVEEDDHIVWCKTDQSKFNMPRSRDDWLITVKPHPPGSVVAGKEAWSTLAYNNICHIADDEVVYRADKDAETWESEYEGWRWRPAQTMPRRLCRLWLAELETRAVRVGEITAKDFVVSGLSIPDMKMNDPRIKEAQDQAGGFDAGHCQLAANTYRDHLKSRYPAAEWFWLTRFAVRVGAEQ